MLRSQVRRIDLQLKRLQSSSESLRNALGTSDTASDRRGQGKDSPQIKDVEKTLEILSAESSSRPPLLHRNSLLGLLEQSHLLQKTQPTPDYERETAVYLKELEWLIVCKIASQTYGLILDSLLERAILLSDDIWYWEECLGSYAYTSLYSVQTAPIRFWAWSKDIYRESRRRFESLKNSEQTEFLEKQAISDRWTRFYGLVRDSIRDRSLAQLQSKAIYPLTSYRDEMREKEAYLKKLREMLASGLGVLMDEALTFDTDDESLATSKNRPQDANIEEWKSTVAKSVALMEVVLGNVTNLEVSVSEFEDTVFMKVEEDHEIAQHPSADAGESARVTLLASRLQNILKICIPRHVALSKDLAREHGRPPYIVRYWFPATMVLLSSSTLLRIFFKRRAEILTWIRDLGSTVEDFWFNWVVDPLKRVIGTIRHDSSSEVAIMSKESLADDKASLERMVIDFAMDNSESGMGTQLSQADVAEIAGKVREGYLTLVLKAYEKDLRRPIVGALWGDLIRALFIQLQKSKVDVEVAMGGIDTLLKSQELVFGLGIPWPRSALVFRFADFY